MFIVPLLLTTQLVSSFLFPTTCPTTSCSSCPAPCPPPPVCPPVAACPPPQACCDTCTGCKKRQARMYISHNDGHPGIPRIVDEIPVASLGEFRRQTTYKIFRKRGTPILGNGTFVIDRDDTTQKRKKRNVSSDVEDVLDDVVRVDAKCNSEELRDIIIENIDRVTSISKRRIQDEAELRLHARFNVICARGDFSYLTNTEMFCQQTVGDVTCYVFKQLSDVVRARLS